MTAGELTLFSSHERGRTDETSRADVALAVEPYEDSHWELSRYGNMCAAITACHQVDEVLDIHDKARALEVYAMQARNIDAERKACEIRMRAERRTGELLAQLARNQTAGLLQGPLSNGATTGPSPYNKALADNKLTRQTAHRYQRLADVPRDDFEAELANPKIKPSTSRILSRHAAHSAQSRPACRNEAKAPFEKPQHACERGESTLTIHLRMALEIIRTQASLTVEEKYLIDQLASIRQHR
jgi:hypothetical protein